MMHDDMNDRCEDCDYHSQPDEDGMGECAFLSGQSEGRIMSEGTVKTPNDFSCQAHKEKENAREDMEIKGGQGMQPMSDHLKGIEGDIASQKYEY